MNQRFETCRQLLNDVAQPSSFDLSVQALEDAFNYSSGEHALVWKSWREGDDVPLFGERTLRQLLGKSFGHQIAERRANSGGVFELDEHDEHFEHEEVNEHEEVVKRPGMRLEVQRYVVVGRRSSEGGVEKTVCLLFHAGQVSCFQRTEGPVDREVRHLELLRVRAGLMNRRQALLLASHLNRFRRSVHHGEPLVWSVVSGPGPDASARRWLDGIAGAGEHLLSLEGDLPSWGLQEHASDALAMYVVERKYCAHPEQVFKYGAPRRVLPMRFKVWAKERERSRGIPEDAVWVALRSKACTEAYALAKKYEDEGFFSDERPSFPLDLADFWGPYEDGVPFSGPGYTDGAAHGYATSFSRDEARRVVRTLRAANFRSIQVMPANEGGSYARYETFCSPEICPTQTLEVTGGEPFEIKVSTSLVLPDRHTPIKFWEPWEEEAFDAIRAYRAGRGET